MRRKDSAGCCATRLFSAFRDRNDSNTTITPATIPITLKMTCESVSLGRTHAQGGRTLHLRTAPELSLEHLRNREEFITV